MQFYQAYTERASHHYMYCHKTLLLPKLGPCNVIGSGHWMKPCFRKYQVGLIHLNKLFFEWSCIIFFFIISNLYYLQGVWWVVPFLRLLMLGQKRKEIKGR
jgi:hypothetical protein